jgi:hypothetical protein
MQRPRRQDRPEAHGEALDARPCNLRLALAEDVARQAPPRVDPRRQSRQDRHAVADDARQALSE